MSTKYDWSNVPKNITYISTDWEGWKQYHTSKPILHEDLMCFDSGKTDTMPFSECWKDSEFKGYWQESLEERPK